MNEHETEVSVKEALRELTADRAQWLVLNRAMNLEPWLCGVPASVVRRIGLAAQAHDWALANAKGENL